MQDQTTLLPAGLSQEKRELLEMLLDKEKASRFRLSFAQKRLWFLDKLEPDRSFYSRTKLAPTSSLSNGKRIN